MGFAESEREGLSKEARGHPFPLDVLCIYYFGTFSVKNAIISLIVVIIVMFFAFSVAQEVEDRKLRYGIPGKRYISGSSQSR
jgi:hypothetical protein